MMFKNWFVLSWKLVIAGHSFWDYKPYLNLYFMKSFLMIMLLENPSESKGFEFSYEFKLTLCMNFLKNWLLAFIIGLLLKYFVFKK